MQKSGQIDYATRVCYPSAYGSVRYFLFKEKKISTYSGSTTTLV